MPGRSSPVEPLVGFEPTACWLQISCSTAELQRHILLFLIVEQVGLEPTTSHRVRAGAPLPTELLFHIGPVCYAGLGMSLSIARSGLCFT